MKVLKKKIKLSLKIKSNKKNFIFLKTKNLFVNSTKNFIKINSENTYKKHSSVQKFKKYSKIWDSHKRLVFFTNFNKSFQKSQFKYLSKIKSCRNSCL